MKTKILLTGIICILIASCSSPEYLSSSEYLPSSNEIDVNPYGSYIEIEFLNEKKIDGELISIDSNQLVLLKTDSLICKRIALNTVANFSLRYAKSKNYGWTIPTLALTSISHGLFAIFTLPINLIVSISVTSAGKNAFQYNFKEMDFNQLKMFARFPQGIPKGMELESIKRFPNLD